MGDWPSILSVLSTRSTKWKQAFERPMDCHSPSELQSSAHIATFLFKLISENSWLVVYVSTTCFQELGPFLQTLLRLNHKNKNSSHKLRKSWMACSHGNQWPPGPVLNLFSYDNPPQLTALVSKPASPWWPLAFESQLVRDRLSPDLSGVNSHSPSDCPADGISPCMSVKFTGPWPSDVPKTLYQCNSLLCSEGLCRTSFDLFQTLGGGLVILWRTKCETDVNHMKLMIFNCLWPAKTAISYG